MDGKAKATFEKFLEANRGRPQARAMRTAGYTATRLSKSLGKTVGGPAPRSSVAQIARDWADHAGRYARLSRPVRLQGTKSGTVLVVEATGSAGALIQADSARIISAINARLGAGTVRGLRVVQGRVARQTPIHKSAAGLTPGEEAELREGLSAAPEGGLRDALEAFGRSVAMREKELRRRDRS